MRLPTYGEVIAIVGLAHLYKGKTDTSQDEYDGHDFRHEAEYLASYADDHHYCSSEEDVVLYFCHLFLFIYVVLLFVRFSLYSPEQKLKKVVIRYGSSAFMRLATLSIVLLPRFSSCLFPAKRTL